MVCIHVLGWSKKRLVSNKPGGYSQADIDFLQPFLVTCSNLLYASTQAEANKRLEVKLADAPLPVEITSNKPEGRDATTKMKAMVSQRFREFDKSTINHWRSFTSKQR